MKYLLSMLLAMAPAMAHADGSPSFEVGYSTWAVQGVVCTTGTAVNLTASANRPSLIKGPFAGYLIQNQDSSDSVWLSNTVDISATAGSGLKLVAGGDWAIHLGREKRNDTALLPIWCEADSAAGTAAVQLVVVWFGY